MTEYKQTAGRDPANALDPLGNGVPTDSGIRRAT